MAPRSFSRRGRNSAALALCIPLLGAALAGPVPASADVPPIQVCTDAQTLIDYPDFGASSELQLNGTAQILGEPAVLRLIEDGVLREAGSAFAEVGLPPGGSFHTEFVFAFSGEPPQYGPPYLADGITFTLQTDGPEALGRDGSSLGYEGIYPSVSAQFASYSHNEARIASASNAYPDILTRRSLGDLGIDLNTPGTHYAWVDYDGSTLEVRVSGADVRPDDATLSHDLDIPQLLGSGPVYAGFTGSTGGLDATHEILSWTLDAASCEPVDHMIRELSSDVQALAPSKIVKSLTPLLEGALKNLADGDVDGALDKLISFVNQIDAQAGKRKISTEDAESLIEAAQPIIAALQEA